MNAPSQIINLTAHPLTVIRGSRIVLSVPPSGIVARLIQHDAGMPDVLGIPVVSRRFDGVTGLPDAREGVMYFVAGMVLDALPQRVDLLAPGAPVRDDDGRTVGIDSFRASWVAGGDR